jgi:hypothetical protein
MRTAALLICAVLVLPSRAFADSVTLPSPAVTGGHCGIVGCGTQFQQIYSSFLFSGPLQITSLTLFNTTRESAEGFIEPAHYTFYLGTTTTAWDAMTTNFSANATGPLVQVADFTIVDYDYSMYPPGPGVSKTIAFSTPFLYMPGAGNLILSVAKDRSEEAGDGPVYIDYNGNAPGVSWAMNYAPGGVEQNRFVVHGGGIITRFNGEFTPAPVPEPASLILVGTGIALAGARRRRALRRCSPDHR